MGSVAALLLGALALGSEPGAAQRIEGRLVDAATGNGIADGTLSVLNEEGHARFSVGTDSTGWFVLPLPRSGETLLRAEALGYQTWDSEPIAVDWDEALEVTITLSVRALELDPLVVTARRQDVHRAFRDFYRRSAHIERTGFGRVLDKETLEKSWVLSHRLREIPGLRYSTAPDGTLRLGRHGCPGGAFLNGMYVGNPDLDELVFATDLEGVEIYRSEAEVPPELGAGGGEALCTVVALWTRADPTSSSGRGAWFRWGLLGALVGGFAALVAG
ncbi:MAG: carboxypeptidase-like regulatory domain-containing protein [Gemmatimonadota bacterium]